MKADTKRMQPVVWHHRKPAKSNPLCLYCGRWVGESSTLSSNKEHLIAREFVPKGAFGDGNAFNFIFRACERCNNEKSDAERHISSVTLHNSISQGNNLIYADIALRKASKDYHPDKRGMLVKDAGDQHSLAAAFGPVQLTATLTSPPQLNRDFVERLCFMHMQGLYAYLFTDNYVIESDVDLLQKQDFLFYASFVHSDWGNPALQEVTKRSEELNCVLNVNTADKNFKAIVYQETDERGALFWALEWNQYLRVIGGISKNRSMPTVLSNLPQSTWGEWFMGDDGLETRVKNEISLSDDDDTLFHGTPQKAPLENADVQ